MNGEGLGFVTNMNGEGLVKDLYRLLLFTLLLIRLVT